MSRHPFGVATWIGLSGVATPIHDMVLAALWWFGVATKVLDRDMGIFMGELEAGRDIDLRSRPGLALRASRQGFDVATWAFGCG